MKVKRTPTDIFNEPPDPRLLKLAGKAVDSMKRYDAWFAALSPEDQEKEREAQIQRGADFICDGPDEMTAEDLLNRLGANDRPEDD